MRLESFNACDPLMTWDPHSSEEHIGVPIISEKSISLYKYCMCVCVHFSKSMNEKGSLRFQSNEISRIDISFISYAEGEKQKHLV